MSNLLTLTSITLFPSLIIFIALRLKNIRKNLPFAGSVPYSRNSCIFLGVICAVDVLNLLFQ